MGTNSKSGHTVLHAPELNGSQFHCYAPTPFGKTSSPTRPPPRAGAHLKQPRALLAEGRQ